MASSIFFFYTLGILIVFIVTAVLSIAAWASSGRKLFIYASGAFICYTVEIIEIFFNEHISQNLTFTVYEYYAVSMPILRTLIATLSQAFIWATVLRALDKHSQKLFVIPPTVFLAAEALILTLMPAGRFMQFAYYTTRQVFLFFVLGYIVYHYVTTKDENQRMRLGRYKKHLIVTAIMLVFVLLEDAYNILWAPMGTNYQDIMLYLSERNISENILACYLAVLIIRYAFSVLSIRLREAPDKNDVTDLERHVDEQMEFFTSKHKLSKRESEVLKLVVLGKNNQEIAKELFLALGTVKTHVHNIMVKTGCADRASLTKAFWNN